MHTSYRIYIETLENGYKVEVPDMAAMAKNRASKKSKAPLPYESEMKSFAAKNTKEVLKLVRASLEQMPEHDFDTAFNESASKL